MTNDDPTRTHDADRPYQTDAQAGYNLGLAAAQPRVAADDAVEYVVIADQDGAARVQLINDEPLRVVPYRPKGVMRFDSIDSFIEYVNRQRTPQTIILADHQGRAEAIFDHHPPSHGEIADAGWGDFRAILERKQTPAYQAWMKHDGAWLSQLEFAEFLEDRMGEIAAPDGATLWEVVRNFEAKSDVAYSSAIRLDTGAVELHFTEELSGGARGSMQTVTVPTEFTLALQPFIDAPEQSFIADARLRWRLRGTEVSFAFRLDEDVAEKFDTLIAESHAMIEARTDLRPLFGAESVKQRDAVAPQGDQLRLG